MATRSTASRNWSRHNDAKPLNRKTAVQMYCDFLVIFFFSKRISVDGHDILQISVAHAMADADPCIGQRYVVAAHSHTAGIAIIDRPIAVADRKSVV